MTLTDRIGAGREHAGERRRLRSWSMAKRVAQAFDCGGGANRASKCAWTKRKRWLFGSRRRCAGNPRLSTIIY